MQPLRKPTYGTLVIHPRAMQFAINDLPLILLCLTGYVCAGMEGMPYTGLLAGASTACLLLLLYRFFYLRRMEFRIHAEQLIYEHGVFARSCEYIELYRIVDFRESRSFLQLLFGLKTVCVYSGDHTTPQLNIIGVDVKSRLVDIIRERVETNKQRKGIYEITNR